MTSNNYRNLEQIYKNRRGGVNIGQDLVKTCLKECKLYRRGTAYFSSSSLMSYADLIEDLIEKEVRIQILCSPVIQDQRLIEILDNNSTQEKREKIIKEAENILLSAVGFQKDPANKDYRSEVLSYMIAKGQLIIKFAIPKDYETLPTDGNYDPIYHVKNGYFKFPNGDRVAFDGSFNETRQGHVSNRERAQVFRSWVDIDINRLDATEKDVDLEWNDLDDDLDILSLDDEIIKIIKKLAPKTKPIKPKDKDEFELWDHQKDAIEVFMDKKNGILEMATGTGKTTTALEIVKRLYEEGKIDSVIISTYGTSLLSQWVKEIDQWKQKNKINSTKRNVGGLHVFKNFDRYHDLNRFLSLVRDSIIVISDNPTNLKDLLSRKSLKKHIQKTLIIYDEIHNFGSNKKVTDLKGLHQDFEYKLGLSATPIREYDEIGTKFIEEEIGKSIFQYEIKDAIEDGILCEFKYHPIDFSYTDEDNREIQRIYAGYQSSIKNGNDWPKEKLWRKLSNVRKKAEAKPSLLYQFLNKNKKLIKSSIFFVQDTDQGNEVAKIVNKFTKSYTTFYQGSPDKFIELLEKNQIDSVIACERLNEGVDIKSLKNIFLVATPRAKLTTIQRIGRCLRVDPNNKTKKSNIIDFILRDNTNGPKNNEEIVPADSYRKEWIMELSKVKKVKKSNA